MSGTEGEDKIRYYRRTLTIRGSKEYVNIDFYMNGVIEVAYVYKNKEQWRSDNFDHLFMLLKKRGAKIK